MSNRMLLNMKRYKILFIPYIITAITIKPHSFYTYIQNHIHHGHPSNSRHFYIHGYKGFRTFACNLSQEQNTQK